MGLAPRTRTRIAAAVLALPLAGAPAVLLTAAARAQSGPGVVATLANRFDPDSLTVPAGTTVTWTSEGGFHTVTGGDGTEDPASPIGNHTMADASATVQVTFDTPGTYKYFCQPHVSLGMTGEIIVTAAGGAAAAPTAAATTAPPATASPAAAPTDAPADPGAGLSESAGPGAESGGEGHSTIPGSTAEDNPTLREIEEQRAADAGKLGGFDALLWASTAALIALCVAVFASTRPRRSSR